MCTNTPKRDTSQVHRNHKANKIFQGMASTMLIQAFLAFRRCLDMFIDFIFGFYWESKRQPIPDLLARHRMLAESAVTLAARIRNKELTSENLVQACIERIKLVNKILNAVTDERFEEALKDARNVDKNIAEGLPDAYFVERPFLGVPFTTKESNAIAGVLNTLGLLSRRHIRAAEDAESVRLMRAAGAIPLAVTNVPEVNKWQECRNLLFGTTCNPYHSGRSTGGSSGGEGALCAAYASPISLCSDIGGSTRMPAFFCGLFALNPTAGYTNLRGLSLRTGEEPTMAAVGFVSRHCSDLAPLTAVVAGDKAPLLTLNARVDPKTIDYYYVETAQDLRVSPICSDLRQAMNRVISKLTELTPSTDKAPKPYYHEGFNHMFVLWRYWMTRETEKFPKVLTNNRGEAKALVELPKKILGLSQYTMPAIMKLFDEQVMPPVNAQWAEKLTKELSEDLVARLGERGVLLFPSAPAPAPYHAALMLRPFNFAYWGIFNVLRLPAAQVPLGLNSDGLPIGIQVVAGPRQEALCLSVAQLLEKEFGGFVPPCKILN
ncbi:fatty-acid amide hydrolase 2-like [Achroia grisella]|uniref:fatty-acid amide hydrolase 2-like n=1 Tax=Achroia grisella TaxID=688607 RepID=UPI0027D2AFE4|nr:fatty-acid amide hydrolase 2-like [Achroia grisella]